MLTRALHARSVGRSFGRSVGRAVGRSFGRSVGRLVPSPGINEHPIARMKMILRPVDSEFYFLQFLRVKSSK